MGWDSVVDQDIAKSSLQHAIAGNRVGHAYLFHGPDGGGKRALALAFAQALQCQNRADGEFDACGTCNACVKVSRMTHPDVKFLMPYPILDSKKPLTLPKDYRLRQELVAENPYQTVDYLRRFSLEDGGAVSNKQPLYPVDWVHDELIHKTAFTPVEGEYKIIILADADRMNSSSANAFLKRLEEPFADTIFVLLTERPDHLPSTIVSRTQKVYCTRLSSASIGQHLMGRGVPEQNAAFVSRMSDGSMSRALELAEHEKLGANRAMVVDFLRIAIVDDTEAVEESVRLMASSGREQLKSYLDLLLSWVRDLVVLQATGDSAMLVNVDQFEAIQKFVSNLPDADLGRMATSTEEAIHLIGRNVSASSVLRCLAISLRDSMRGRPGGNLYQPLSRSDVGSVAKRALA